MKGVAKPKSQTLCGAHFRETKGIGWFLASLLPALLFQVVMIGIGPGICAVTNASNPDSAKANMPVVDYSKFFHASPKEHLDLMGLENCASCHRRSDALTEPRFPVHKDCTGCHLVQFTASNSSSSVNPICTICHKADGLNSPTAPLKS